MTHRSLSLAINMLDIECYRTRVGSSYSRFVMNIYQKLGRKNNVGFKSRSLYRLKKLSKTPVSFFGFVSLIIATYFLLKLIIEDIESNPGPSYVGAYGIKNAVQGTFHQGNTRFGETADIQCTSNAYFAIIFSAIKIWKATEINYVLNKADMPFKSLRINKILFIDELPHVANIEGYTIHTDFILQHSDVFEYNDNLFEHIRNLDSSHTGNGVIFTFLRVFLFGSHSRNIEGFPDPNGSAVL